MGPRRVYELLLPLLHIGEEGTRIFNMRHIVAAVRDGDFVGDCLSIGGGVAAMATDSTRERRRFRGAEDSAPNSRALRRVPRDQARALPAAFYTSREYLEFEREALFRTQWICLGHIGAIPNVGDYFTTELVDEQLLIVRDTLGHGPRAVQRLPPPRQSGGRRAPATPPASCAAIMAGPMRSMAGCWPRR